VVAERGGRDVDPEIARHRSAIPGQAVAGQMGYGSGWVV
jgi:hypothetical protein